MIAQMQTLTPPPPATDGPVGGLRIGDKALAATLELVYLRPILDGLPGEFRTAVDIGAHRGDVTGELLGRGWRVLAVEPQGFLADRLEQRFASELKHGRLRVERCAASDRRGTSALYVGSASTVSSLEPEWTTVAFPEEFRSPRRLDVPVCPAADLLVRHGLGRIGFAKVDVEGHELSALCGLLADPDAAPPPAVVMFEANHCFGDRAEACLEFLWSQGYHTFDLFVRWGVDPIAADRFWSPCLPGAWRRCEGRNFYANIIAYHSAAPAAAVAAGRLDPVRFVREYQVLKARDLLRTAAAVEGEPSSTLARRLRDEVLAGGWEGFPDHAMAEHFRRLSESRAEGLLTDLRRPDGRLPRWVVEVDAGYGLAAQAYLAAEPDAAYVIVDEPERLAVQYFYLTLAMPQVVVEFAEGPDARPRPGRVLLVRPGLAATVAAGAELLFSSAAWEALPPEMRRLVERESEFGARAGYFGGEWTIGARAGSDTDDSSAEAGARCACGAD